MIVFDRRLNVRRIFQPTCIPGIELWTSQLGNCSFPRQMHEQYEFAVFDAGVGELAYRGTREVVGPTQVVVIAPGEVHDTKCESRWELRNAYLSKAVVHEIAKQLNIELREGLHFPECVIANNELKTQMTRFMDAISIPDTLLRTESILVSALRCLFESFTDPALDPKPIGREPKAVRQCRSFLESHVTEEVRLETLTAVCGVSAFHLIRSFKRRFGIPPHAYQLRLRLNAAKAALRSGSTAAQAAVASGFFDQSHLHRHFSRAFGITPLEYRRMTCGSSTPRQVDRRLK